MTAPGLAHAKAILLGEHAVVQGAPALVAGLEAGMSASVTPAPGPLSVTVSPWGLKATAGDGSVPGQALTALGAALVEAGLDPEALERRVTVRAEVPASVGLGSSAALGVALVRGLVLAAGRPDLAEPESAARLADASEGVFHAHPSGVDAAIAAHGGVGRFDRTRGFTEVTVGRPAMLVVADSGPRPTTREMVLRVQSATTTDPDAAAALTRLGQLSDEGVAALSGGDLQALGGAMDEAQHHLVSLGLSTPQLDWLCATARQAGALGAKLTGAGGGGCMIALCRPERGQLVLDALSHRARWAALFPLRPPPAHP